MIIIDPDFNGCIIWSGNCRQRLNGTAKECCNRIISKLFCENNKGEKVQITEILLDVNGIGKAFEDIFEKEGIKFSKVTTQVYLF